MVWSMLERNTEFAILRTHPTALSRVFEIRGLDKVGVFGKFPIQKATGRTGIGTTLDVK